MIIRLATWEETPKGYYNRPLVLVKNKHCFHVLDAGLSDEVIKRYTKEYVLVLSVNQRLGYIGLQAFDRKDLTEVGSTFDQNPDPELLAASEAEQISQLLEVVLA